MSAYVVSLPHINALVEAAQRPGKDHFGPVSWYWGNPSRSRKAEWNEGDSIGKMLLAENIKSVAYRYREPETSNELPGPIPLPTVEGYTFEHPRISLGQVAILKALDGYEYQSCEHPGWEKSEARAFCEALRSRMIHELPGYDDAEWEIAS